MYSFSKQLHRQMIQEPLQSHASVFSFYAMYAHFHLFKFLPEEITGVHDVNVLSFPYSFMFFYLFDLNVQLIQ